LNSIAILKMEQDLKLYIWFGITMKVEDFFECRLSEVTMNLYRNQGYLNVDIWDGKTNHVIMPN